ncbi:imidazole glycerol phosphate synthase subunit HisF [Candidatus Peregrinibacteria bacterium]|nr:imidazole glycerol phosphate synthase subunit HisF [Candidatus Peregrinibacteria bacterium]MBT7736496.1 imidazole glycerol phosphate synthase subunit HisF [Candidatus Peregrinibacteria bacterium]
MDIDNGRVVKGTNFKNLRDAGDAVELAKVYDQMGADELVFLDITATVEQRKTLVELVSQISKNISIPFTVGGGIRSVCDIRDLLNAGADKISLGSIAISDPKIVTEASDEFGSQCIVISLDCKRDGNSWKLFTKGGREKTDLDAVEFASLMEKVDAGELLVNSLDRDGMKNGYDLELLTKISEVVNIPVIASSGAGCREDFLKAFDGGRADGALAASLFHYGEINIRELKRYLSDQKVTIRL